MYDRSVLLMLICLISVLFSPYSAFAKKVQRQVVTVYGSTTCISRFLEPGASDLEKMTGILMRTVGVGTGQGLFALLQGIAEVSAASEPLEQAVESAKKFAATKNADVWVPPTIQFHKIADGEGRKYLLNAAAEQ